MPKNWIKHLRRQRRCVSTSAYQSAASSSPYTRTSIKFSPSRSKTSRENPIPAEAKVVGFWWSFWSNGAFNEVDFEHWLTGDSAEMARAWPYYLTRLLNILNLLIADLPWKLLIASTCISVPAFFCFDCFAARWLLDNWGDDEWKREKRSFLNRIRSGASSEWRYIECRM